MSEKCDGFEDDKRYAQTSVNQRKMMNNGTHHCMTGVDAGRRLACGWTALETNCIVEVGVAVVVVEVGPNNCYRVQPIRWITINVSRDVWVDVLGW